MMTMPVAEQLPVQPVKVEPVAGLAVAVISVLLLNEAEQVAPQLIPAGLEVTVPEPVPALEIVRVWELTVQVLEVVVHSPQVQLG